MDEFGGGAVEVAGVFARAEKNGELTEDGQLS